MRENQPQSIFLRLASFSARGMATSKAFTMPSTPFIPMGISGLLAVYSVNLGFFINYINSGIPLFLLGMFINLQADHILRNLRRPGEKGYQIPYGGMFEYVSGANFFGEILEWIGYALFAQSQAALAFALFTAANTIPRAREHHKFVNGFSVAEL